MMLDSVEWRKKRGISLESISAATRISCRYLEAIECGKFDGLPGEVYARNYIRQYAKAIQYDENELLEQYRNSMPPSETAAGEPAERLNWLDRASRAARFLMPASRQPALPD